MTLPLANQHGQLGSVWHDEEKTKRVTHDFSGEPPGTRTQGPRLKSLKDSFLAAA
jgi:hypothetical protein